MKEGGRPRIPQEGLRRFQRTVVDLAGDKGSKEYPLPVDGEDKVVEVSFSREGKSTDYRMRDAHPVGPDESRVYEEFFCSEDDGSLHVIYIQGSLVESDYGYLVDPAIHADDPLTVFVNRMNVFDGIAMRVAIEGEPVDEFDKSMMVLDEIQAGKETGGNSRRFRWPFKRS